MRHNRWYLISCHSLIGLCWLVSCRTAAPREPGAAGKDAHWVHSTELRTQMAVLDRATKGDWPQEIAGEAPSRDEGTDPCVAEAVEHAEALALAARRIPESASRARLAEVDRRSFIAQAETLYDQATRWVEAARQADAPAMRLALADIDATCHSCHTRFRDVSGVLRR